MQKKLNYIDVLTVISCIGVVFLHTNGVFWSHPKGRLWITSNIIETFFYYAVPIFFMITGTTLIDFSQRYSLKNYFTKRIKRTVIPYIIWSIVAFLITSLLLKQKYEGNFILNLINNKFMGIYWFFIPLFAIYLSIPVLNKINKDSRIYIYIYINLFFYYSFNYSFYRTIF